MTVRFGILAVAIAGLALSVQEADAGPRKKPVDPRLQGVALGVRAASKVGYFALRDWRWSGSGRYYGVTKGGAYAFATIGCMAVAPMVGTAVVRRPLTYREAHVMMGGCVIPVVGGWLVNAAYEANPHWERFDRPRRR